MRSPEEEQELVAACRAMPWKKVVRLIKETAATRELVEIPKAVQDWFDLNRANSPSEQAAQDVLARLRQVSEIAPAILQEFAEAHERAPVGPWWCAIQHYLRDGKRWWLLRTWLDDYRDVSTATKDEERRLDKIVKAFGGDPKDPLFCTGEQWFFTWPAGR